MCAGCDEHVYMYLPLHSGIACTLAEQPLRLKWDLGALRRHASGSTNNNQAAKHHLHIIAIVVPQLVVGRAS